jgi:hypothetical protein
LKGKFLAFQNWRCENANMNYDPELRLTKLIRQKTEGTNKIALNHLLKEINAANIKVGRKPLVNFRILRKLKAGDPSVGLTRPMLIALSVYWPELTQQPAFVMPGIYEALMATPKVIFMLGAKPRTQERRNDISHWDALSLAEVLTRCSKQDLKHEFEIRYGLWHASVNPKTITTESWYNALEEDQTSVVSIGSPLVSLSSEVMLARMMGVVPFMGPGFRLGNQVPFFFAWRWQAAGKFQSAFGLSPQELQPIDAKIANEVKRNRASAFVLDGMAHIVSAKGKSWIMHGIIAAQRRAAGNVWLVVSGLAGPATYAAALKVKDIVEELPWSMNKPSRVLWVPVKVHVQARENIRHGGDIREIGSAEFDGNVRFWPA